VKVMADIKNGGYPIVLTASRVEANDFGNNPFSAFICTFPKKLSGYFLRDHINDLSNNNDGSAKYTIYGLRKVESLLVQVLSSNHLSSPDLVMILYSCLNSLTSSLL